VRMFFHAASFLFSPTDLARTSAAIFFTRWITHLCAPAFVFLAGLSVFLSGERRSRQDLSSFLFKRGLWLVAIEILVINLFRSFNPTYPLVRLQVIWAIAAGLMALAAVVRLDTRWILGAGLLMIAAHNLLDRVHVSGQGLLAFAWAVLHEPKAFTFGEFTLDVFYPLVPWIGVMFVGYGCGTLYARGRQPEKRKKALLSLGLAALALFVLLRSANVYGDAAPWSGQGSPISSLLSFLNVTKYPPSLLFLLLMLGPAFVFLALSEKPLGGLGEKLTIFGRTAMFFYVAHFLLIHLFAVFGAISQGYRASDMVLSTGLQAAPQLRGYGFDLWVVYGVWASVVLLLYPLCRWFDRYKRAHVRESPWLSYF
jgi:uncharacterized membrane protein